MAEGSERIRSFLGEAVEQTHPGVAFGLGASSGCALAEGEVDFGEMGDVAKVSYAVESNGRIRAELLFDNNFARIEDVLVWARAVWDGAASKGFPDPDWKH